jgi:hypothetical protein
MVGWYLGGVPSVLPLMVLAAATSTTSEEPDPFTLRGYVQLEYARFDRSSDQLSDGSGEPLNENRFFVRDARIKLLADWGYVGFGAQGEVSTVNGPAVGVRLLEGVVKYPGVRGAPPLARLAAGIIPVPFMYENHLQGNETRFFGERSLMADAFLPGRFDVGASLSGSYRFWSWIAAVQNGEPIGERSFPGRDPNGAKDFSSRIGVDFEIVEGLALGGGVSGLTGTGFSPGRTATKDTFVWRDLNEDGLVSASELQVVKGSAARPSENYNRWGVGLDLEVRIEVPVIGELFVYGEAVMAKNLDRGVAPADPIAVGRAQRSRGFYAAFLQEVTDYFAAGARVDVYQPNVDQTELHGGETVITRRTFTSWTLSAAGYLPLGFGPRAKLLAEYVIQKNSLGRDASGNPAQLANDTLRFRLEVAF